PGRGPAPDADERRRYLSRAGRFPRSTRTIALLRDRGPDPDRQARTGRGGDTRHLALRVLSRRGRHERGASVRETERGFTYFMILATVILPTAKVLRKRQKEIELRRELRILRTAIDGYKRAVSAGQIGGTDVKVGSEGYPPDLDVLVKGVSQVGKI